MTYKSLLLLLLFTSTHCVEPQKPQVEPQKTAPDISREAIVAELKSRENASISAQYDSLGTLEQVFSFEVKTADQDGVGAGVHLASPEADLPNLLNKNERLLAEAEVKVLIDYPLIHHYFFSLSSSKGFSRTQLVEEISRIYQQIYAEEEQTASIKTLPVKERQMYNRNTTNGKYGIWGHDIGDLVLTKISVYKPRQGPRILVLYIES